MRVNIENKYINIELNIRGFEKIHCATPNKISSYLPERHPTKFEKIHCETPDKVSR